GRPLRARPQRGRVGARRRGRAARRLRRRAPAGGDRRAAPAQHGRDAAALGARLPDPVASRHRVLLPAQAGAALAPAERVLRRRLRARLGARGGVRDGLRHARAAGGDRRGRAARRGLLPVQRGDRLVLPLPAGGLAGALLSGGGVRARRRRLARRSPVCRERARAPPLPRQAPRPARGRARPPAAARGSPPARPPLPRRAGARVPGGRALARLRLRRAAARRAPRVSRLPRELAVVPALLVARTFPDSGLGLYLKLAAATLAVLLPGSLVARALRRPSVSATLAWTLACLFASGAVVFAVHGTLGLAIGLVAAIGACALAVVAASPQRVPRRRPAGAIGLGAVLGILVWQAAGT